MSTQTLTENVDDLFDLVRKSEGIISTFEARSLETEPETVEEEYRRYANTHVSLGDTSEFEQEIYEKVTEQGSPAKGYLYGPYGYGKTSTAVSIWNTLSEQEIIAVPPFTMDSFAAIMRATYGWMRHEFDNKAPDYVDDLDDIHERYLQQELRAVAKQKQDQHDLDFDKLVQMFEEMEQENNLDLSINADTLIDFFDECTELAQDAGFDALVVVGDEFQEYLNSADNQKDAESRFRQLVFGLHSGAQIRDEFGLFISMPEKTKSTFDSRAEDILNRLQRDNLVLNLQTVYGREFPAELWSRYADRFGFTDEQHDVISEHALTATGEVCSRNDLSNGPRTVIDIFRLALKQYLDTQETFTALDLAEAFYEGDVRYQGSSTKIQSAIGDALDHSAADTPEKQTFLKLCAVFPVEGIPDSVVEEYELEDARESLSKKIHGEVIKVIADGYTLIDVTKRDGPEDVVQQLIRDFWREYSVGHGSAEHAVDALANKLLNEGIFEAKRGTLDGWTNGGGSLNEIQHTVYKDQFDGTFDTRFPKRRLNVAVSDDTSQDEIVGEHGSLGEYFGDPDLAFNFVLTWESGDGHEHNSHIKKESDREFTFVLDGRQSFDELPQGLDFLRDAMDPNAVTPFLMLALVQYLEDPNTELDAQQENRVESFQQSLLDQALKALFDETLISNAPVSLRRAGKRAVEGLFTSVMEDLYPDYHTVITSTQYKDMMQDYADFLASLDTISKRRGSETVNEPKEDVAERFGLRKTSPFDGRIRKHYSDLLTVENEEAEEYEVRAELHPLETEIIDRLESGSEDELALAEVEGIAYEKGYRNEEVDVISQFMQARGIVGMNETGDALVIQEADVSVGDVESALSDARELVDTIEELDPDRVPNDVPEQLDDLETDLDQTNPDASEKLEAIHVEAKYVIDRLEEVGELLHSHHQSECDDLKTKAERKRRSLIPDHLENEVTGGVQFVGGLNDARSELIAEFRAVKSDLTDLIEDLEDARREHNSPTVAAAHDLHQEVEDARNILDSIETDTNDLEEYAEELKRWRTFTDKAANVKQDIKDYSRTFDEALDEEDDIEDFIAQIAERLVENPLDALMNRDAFEERLEHIEESYQQRREQRREVFDAKRETLKTVLDEATEGGTVGLRSATFDVKQPDESRRHLLEDFKSEYESQVLDNAEEKLENAHNEIEYAQIVGVEADTDADPDRVAEEIEQAKAKLRSLRTSLSRFDFQDIDEETELAEEGNELVTEANDLADKARKFRAQSDPEDEPVQDLLHRVENNRGADFKELLMEYHDDGDNIEVDELLERMEQLFKLNQIDIKIMQRRGRR
ncbi:hypothetical protein [Halorientalis regularis]|uniref:Uncharacterized protein n=1 Tax=Halorientalis regularis TaxID=660518 RepID=A0A1G7TQF2_9EURY|nr:hypothetical protein [Halorientalis regularis]SDG37538.1 hypothetical protein SAMN05216218_12812 [Halorientalis regularis]